MTEVQNIRAANALLLAQTVTLKRFPYIHMVVDLKGRLHLTFFDRVADAYKVTYGCVEHAVMTYAEACTHDSNYHPFPEREVDEKIHGIKINESGQIYQPIKK